MIAIQINGQQKELPAPITLRELLKEMTGNSAIAVAVNSEVVPRSEIDKVTLRDRDQVEIIHPVGGG